jgi:hypothetical protein
MSKHTPGPWHLFERNHLCIESDTGNVALCNLARNSEADARLIAAAPDGLEAAHVALVELEAVEKEIGIASRAVPMLKAFIAKATA